MVQGNKILRRELDGKDALLISQGDALQTDFLLLHAGGETGQVWQPVMQHLREAGFTSTAYDQRGHGESTGSTGDGIQTFGRDTVAMIRTHRPAVVAGASLGAYAALLALHSLRDTDQVRGLVLVDAVPAPDGCKVRRFLAAQAPQLSQSPLVDDILSQSRLMTDAAMSLTLPVTLVRAGPSGPVTDEEVRHLQTICPQVQLRHVAEAGHLIARDAPQALARILIDFANHLHIPRKGPLP
ncbi:MAG: alpha/beta hydrolase [Pseudomonadota bacterium]